MGHGELKTMQFNDTKLEEHTGMSLPSSPDERDSEAPTEDFEYTESESSPKFSLNQAAPFTIKFLKSTRDLTCSCKSGGRRISEVNTQKFIDGKLGELDEINELLQVVECTCEQGNQICASQIDHAQSVMDQIDAMCTDYQDRFKNEIKRGVQVKVSDDKVVRQEKKIREATAEFKRLLRADTNEMLFQ